MPAWTGPPGRKRESRPAGNRTAILENGKSGNSNSAENRISREPVNLSDVRFARGVERLHALGPRALGEFLAEIGARYLIRQPIEELVNTYARRLDPVVLRALGGDQFPTFQIRGIEP